MYPKIVMAILIIWNMGWNIKNMIEKDGELGTSIVVAILRAGTVVGVLWWGGFWAIA